ITYELWDSVRTWATSNGYTFSTSSGIKGSSDSGSVLQPVTIITWRDAMVFSNAITEWYNANSGTTYTCAYYTDAAYTVPIRTSTDNLSVCVVPGCEDLPYVKSTATGFRMPTRDEWELAAKYKGSDSSNGAIEKPAGSGYYWTPSNYASGATADYNNATPTKAVAWYSANAGGTTQPVKGKTTNVLGLYDMSGNVDEWTFDWYPGHVGDWRICMGGPYTAAANAVEVGFIDLSVPYIGHTWVGFRLAMPQ
ncbi:MAG TPA: SUMF1/EgtB/PvdO family nonheme iron enzyme, partial [bacterium]|nr:SUMF1/EgtB/PvdO family nonheme iron enzyme [bacterium]